ncbi:hypothetical protein TRVL_08517 [Trypanosoma vivax]|nr:hypothetical protein TRVL_08517 [Trypanosoma vivax]
METGECVCIKDVLANWLKSETTISEILNDMKTLIGEENFEKFITHPAPHLDADNRRCMEMAKKVGEKLLKVLASEFAYLNFPDGDTNKLTNVVRVLISSDTFEPILKSHFFTNLSERDSYTAVLALVLYACGMGVAQQLVLPVFEQTWDIQSYSVHLPSLVAALCPGESTSNLKHEEKIEKICNVLEERGITIKRKTERQERPGSTGTFTVSVFHDGELKHHHECECLGDYFSIVMEEAKKILAADKKKVQNSPQVVLAPSDLRMWMHNVHAILRLHEPYRDHIGENMLDSIIQSNGWIPLSFVNEMLAIASKKKMHALPQRHEWLVQLLNKHDNFGRFQVGVCSMEDSRFKGEECARSFYGHDVSQNLAASIFREFKTVEGQGDVCHVFGWVNVHKQQLEAMKRQEPLKLYNKMQCLYVFSGNTVNEFQEYRVRTPVPEQYDEKLGRRSDLIFLEFCLRAAVRDEKIDVFEVPRKAGGCHWVLFSKYTIEDGIETCIPSYYFTGKVRILKFAGCTTPQTDETEGKVFTEVEVQDEKWSDLTRNPSAPLELTLQWLVDIPHTYSPEELSRIFGTDRPDAEAHDNVDITGDEEKLRQTLHPSERVAFLDTSEYKQKVLKFCSNADESLILLHIPKHNENGFSFCNRSKSIAEFKRWVCDHGLKCQKIRSTDESGVVETYEIRKCGIWNERIVDVVAKELGLSDMRQSDLLRQAMTRECDNKDANYEILEFIGDAVMDFLVVFDSFILGSPWNVNVVSAVCQNRILAHLLPTGLAERLDYLYRDVNMKVKADIVEGIIGAVYRSGVGLDRVRSLLCRFFASLPQRVSGCGNEYLSPKLLEEAIKICPYLQTNSDTLHERHKYNCKFFINDDAAARYKKMSSTPFKCKTTSHYASTPFNRIQQKLHATHFTTGVQYSYRRIASIDTPAIFNRILSAFAANSMAFVNEVFTDNTHVVIDFDGASIKAHGALGLFSRWFRERFSSKSAMFVLTSSGKSIVTKNDKLSYHIHFPQAVVSLEELKSMMDDLTNHIVKHLGLESFAGNIVGYQVPCGNQVVEEANRPTICGRVVL